MLVDFVKGPFERTLAKILGRVFWPPVSVAVLAEGENNDFLVLKRGSRHELPGGIIKTGEDLHESAEREFYEETGFKVDIHDLLDIRKTSYGLTFFFRGDVLQGEKNSSWEGEPVFIKRNEIQDKVWRLEHSHIHEYLFPDNES